MTNKVPPFYANPSNEHCWQACLRMILEHFEPEKTWTWDELDELSGKSPEKWTWAMCSEVQMADRGYEVISYDKTPGLEEKAEDIVEYLKKNNTDPEAFEISLKHTNTEAEQEYSKQVLDYVKQGKVTYHLCNPTKEIMADLLSQGYLIILFVNPRVIQEKTGYAGHFILPYKIDEDRVYYHDSGWTTESEAYRAPENTIHINKLMEAASNRGKLNPFLFAFKKKETN